jgi:hypothetical protein
MLKMFLPIALALATSVAAAPLKIKDSSVSFEASGSIPGLSIEGKGGKLIAKKLQSDGAYIWGALEVPLKDLDTGMDLRNDHMLNKYLAISKYPTATLVLKRTAVVARKFTGSLTIKKDTEKVEGFFNKKGDKIKASFEIDLSKFPSIGTPSWKGVSVSDEVKIMVSATISH